MTHREQLEQLVVAGEQFWQTPDCSAIRAQFDATLHSAREHLKEVRKHPKTVCLCGSTRFWKTFQDAGLRETLAGHVVLSIGAARCADDDDRSFGGYVPSSAWDAIKQQLDDLHLRKIEMADEVLILNVGGYIGPSTRRELNHAIKLGKVVRFLEGCGTESRASD